jgi:hypothetical protein
MVSGKVTGGLRRNAAALVVLAGVLAGLAVMVLEHPIVGAVLMGGTFVCAAIYRASVPDRDAGFLAVRGRNYDVVMLACLGLAIVFLALSLRQTYTG